MVATITTLISVSGIFIVKSTVIEYSVIEICGTKSGVHGYVKMCENGIRRKTIDATVREGSGRRRSTLETLRVLRVPEVAVAGTALRKRI